MEAANLAAALDHACDTDGQCALRLCVSLTIWWKLRGRFALADAAYVRALGAAPPEPSAIKARVLWARGYLLAYGGRFEEAIASEQQALEMARSLQETSTAARALDVLGTIQMYPDPAGVREGLEQSRELARSSGDEWCFVDATQILGFALTMQGDQRAVGVFEEALEIIERTGYAEFAAWHWVGVGGVGTSSRAATRKQSRSTSGRSPWQTRSASRSAPATHTHTGASCAPSEAKAKRRWPTSGR